MRTFDFLAGIVVGWVLTTEEGKATANALVSKAVEAAKSGLVTQPQKPTEITPE